MSASARSSPIPVLEALLRPGREAPARLRAEGLQSFSLERDGVQVAGFGRLHFAELALAQRAAGEGTAAALIQAWRKHGERTCDHLSGEYAFVVWEPAAREGLAAVDRFSTFGLFWGERDGRLALATRPARVCELLGIAAELDPRAVHAYVHFHVVPAPLAIHRGVARLDVGQAIALRRGASEVFAHWKPAFVEDAPFDFAREREAFMGALRAGVAQCVAEVSREALGCFLSGGTDSSTIAGLVTEAYGAPARTFSIGFDESGYDERRYSRLAAQRFGTEHTEHVLSADEVEQAIDVLSASYEQPFGNSSAIPTYVCARIAREAGVERMLGGDGGDELYGGNERYATQWLFSLYQRVPSALRTAALEPLLFNALKNVDVALIRKARSYVEQARLPLPERLGARYNLLNRFGVNRVFTDELLAHAGGFDALALEREVWSRCTAGSQINRLLAFDFKFTLGDSDLPKVARMCHAAGVSVAFPMLADAVVDHSLHLAPGQKLKGRKLRHFFRESLRGFLPDEIIDKPKHGFGMPFGQWVLTQPRLAARVADALGSLEARGIVRKGFLAEVSEALRTGHSGYYGTMVWVLMSLELWMRAQSPTREPLPEPF